MSLDNTIYTLSNINNLLGGTLGYVNDKQSGMSTGYALSNAGFNIMNGAIRNMASKDIQEATGSYIGYAVNSLAGYGNPFANAVGTVGTMNALAISTPMSIWRTSTTCCGSNNWNNGFWGGGYLNSFSFGAPSMFGMNGFFC